MTRKTRKTNKQGKANIPENGTGTGTGIGTGTAILGATALGSVVSGAGGTTITSCPTGDTSFYCRFVKGFNIFKMILVILIVLVFIFGIGFLFFNSRK
jgi:hypothetical protein